MASQPRREGKRAEQLRRHREACERYRSRKRHRISNLQGEVDRLRRENELLQRFQTSPGPDTPELSSLPKIRALTSENVHELESLIAVVGTKVGLSHEQISIAHSACCVLRESVLWVQALDQKIPATEAAVAESTAAFEALCTHVRGSFDMGQSSQLLSMLNAAGASLASPMGSYHGPQTRAPAPPARLSSAMQRSFSYDSAHPAASAAAAAAAASASAASATTAQASSRNHFPPFGSTVGAAARAPGSSLPRSSSYAGSTSTVLGAALNQQQQNLQQPQQQQHGGGRGAGNPMARSTSVAYGELPGRYASRPWLGAGAGSRPFTGNDNAVSLLQSMQQEHQAAATTAAPGGGGGGIVHHASSRFDPLPTVGQHNTPPTSRSLPPPLPFASAPSASTHNSNAALSRSMSHPLPMPLPHPPQSKTTPLSRALTLPEGAAAAGQISLRDLLSSSSPLQQSLSLCSSSGAATPNSALASASSLPAAAAAAAAAADTSELPEVVRSLRLLLERLQQFHSTSSSAAGEQAQSAAAADGRGVRPENDPLSLFQSAGGAVAAAAAVSPIVAASLPASVASASAGTTQSTMSVLQAVQAVLSSGGPVTLPTTASIPPDGFVPPRPQHVQPPDVPSSQSLVQSSSHHFQRTTSVAEQAAAAATSATAGHLSDASPPLSLSSLPRMPSFEEVAAEVTAPAFAGEDAPHALSAAFGDGGVAGGHGDVGLITRSNLDNAGSSGGGGVL